MKLKLIAIIVLALAVVGGVFYFEIGSDQQAKAERSLKNTEQTMGQKEDGKARAYVDAGLLDLQRNDSKAAEDAFKNALDINPNYDRARAALAKLYLAMGNQEKGEREFNLAVRANPENEELLHILGVFPFSMRRLDEYEDFYRNFLKANPDSLAIKKKLMELFIVKGEFDEARSYGGQIWHAHPGDIDVIYLHGRIYLAEKNYVQATEKLFTVSRQSPLFAFAHYFLGLARLCLHNTRETKRGFIEGKEFFPVLIKPRIALAQSYLATGDYDLALAESQPILQVQPDNVEILMVNGVAQLKKDKIEQALEFLHRARNLAPADANPHINIGEAYAVQKKYGQALAEYEEALKLDPERIDTLGSIGQILALSGNPKGALERVQQQLAKTKNKAEIYQLLGQLSVNQQQYEAALSYLEKAVAANPDLLSASFLIARTYIAQTKFDQAVGQLEKIIQNNPRATQAYMLLGSIHDMQQKYQQANQYYQKVLDVDRNSAVAANSLAWNYTQHGGNLDVALTLAQNAFQMSPDDENIAHTLGWIYYKKGGYLSAISLLKESSKKFQDRNPTVLYHLGLAYKKNGDSALAKESFSKALRLNQSFQEAAEAKQALD